MSRRSSAAAAAMPKFGATLSDVDVAARGMCLRSVCDGGRCSFEAGDVSCMANEFFGREALSAVAALRAAGRLPPTPANRPCVERSETGACLACDAGQGDPCQHPALKL